MDAFSSAFFGSVLSTLPIGPINIMLIYLAVDRRWRDWVYCILGVVTADAAVSLFGLYIWNAWESARPEQAKALESYGVYGLAGILIIIGTAILIRSFRSSLEQAAPSGRQISRKGWSFLAFGFLATILEPGLPVFWMGWWMDSSYSFNQHFLPILAGLLLGDGLVFAAYGFLAALIPRPNLRFRQIINRAIGASFLIVAFALIIFH